ncbi:MAG: ABC transporter substrate-binding protein [Rhodospirillaceae bacterium]|jgi:branched-chain amino acid transport system substrate-binding protein|nr:ABC transporter substrate-binding protein [Rhodospirillaceae bacterium]MBT6138989.1 ABC transporter substrate-binding protein [Rhodospirillaceae bacterium]
MNFKRLSLGVLTAVGLTNMVAVEVAIAAEEIFVPGLVYRTGPYAPNGTPFANGFKDYITLINERDGGINGVKVVYEECETGYNTKVGVECYEKLKSKNPVTIIPNSTGITYQLIPKTAVDGIPLLTMGYGRTSAAVGSVFPWVFNFPATYWSQATSVISFIAGKEGGLANLKGKKITHIYHNSAYGKEANPTLEALSKKYGFKLTLLAVDHPGQEQKATWLQIRRKKPDWIFMSGWGVMNQVAIKEAAAQGFPMDHFIGNWWSGSENDVAPAAAGANGYTAATFHAPGGDTKLHADLKKYVYDKGLGGGDVSRIGEVLYIRGLINYIMVVEAARRAQDKYGVKVPNGEQMRWAYENLNVTSADWERIGLAGYPELKVSCNDHEGGHPVLFQQWDAGAKKWNVISDWIPVMKDLVRPMMEADAAKYAKENKITPRKCM